MLRIAIAALILILALPRPASAQEPEVDTETCLMAIAMAAAADLPPGATVMAALDERDLSVGSLVDFYRFAGVEGQPVSLVVATDGWRPAVQILTLDAMSGNPLWLEKTVADEDESDVVLDVTLPRTCLYSVAVQQGDAGSGEYFVRLEGDPEAATPANPCWARLAADETKSAYIDTCSLTVAADTVQVRVMFDYVGPRHDDDGMPYDRQIQTWRAATRGTEFRTLGVTTYLQGRPKVMAAGLDGGWRGKDASPAIWRVIRELFCGG